MNKENCALKLVDEKMEKFCDLIVRNMYLHSVCYSKPWILLYRLFRFQVYNLHITDKFTNAKQYFLIIC